MKCQDLEEITGQRKITQREASKFTVFS